MLIRAIALTPAAMPNVSAAQNRNVFSANRAEIGVFSNDRARRHNAITAGPHQIDFSGPAICDRIGKIGLAADLAMGDTLELWCRNTSHSSNFVFENLTFAAIRMGA